ncbi:HAMP domain-containing protein [Candidatus Leptofilum sp.]|uniref:HAMP domain-containing protein n=1 Tax=Candidatus Leptofilum sp. TaxID=3241576 RepID=UPI003B5CA277
MMLSKFTIKPIFRLASVKARIMFGFGLILILALVIAVIGYTNLRALQNEAEVTLDTGGRIRELSLQIENEFLLARQSETAFVTGWRAVGIDAAVAEYVPANENHLAQARAGLEELDALIQMSDDASLQPLLEQTEALRPLLNTYEDAFQQTVNFFEERGHAEGIEASLKNDLERLEADVQPLDDTALYQLVLQIGANEKSFFGTSEQQYADNIRLLAREFIATVEASSATDLTAGSRQLSTEALVSQINTYVAEFGQLAVLEDGIEINTAVIREVTPNINTVTSQIGAEGEAILALARNRLATISRRSSLTLIVTAVITLSIGTVASQILGQQITSPLRQLSQAAEQIGQGDLEQRVPVTREDELGTLARAFNGMAAELQTTLAELEQRVAARTRDIATSAEISRQLSTILDPAQLAKAVVEQLQAAFDYYYAHIYLLDKVGEYLIMAGGTGKAGQAMVASGHKILLGNGLVGRAAAINAAVLVPDISQEEGWLPNPLLPDTKAEIAVPITFENKILGVLDVQHNVVNGLASEDSLLLESVAAQVAIALHNAELYAQVQQQAQQEAAINEIGEQIRTAASVEMVLQIAARELAQKLDTPRAAVEIGRNHLVGNGRSPERN